MPELHPGARPPGGMLIASTSMPALVNNHDIAESDVHISVVPLTLRPQVWRGTEGPSARMQSTSTQFEVSRIGAPTAHCSSGNLLPGLSKSWYRSSLNRSAPLNTMGPVMSGISR